MRLESERIYLRPLCQLDAPIILESTMDDEIRYMTGTKSTFFIGANYETYRSYK